MRVACGDGCKRRAPDLLRASASCERICLVNTPPSPRSDRLASRLRTALGDRYAFREELPRVGTSRVFRATETSLGRPVVLKVLPPELVGALEMDRFNREIQLAASIPHPHIVPILAAGSLDGVPWYAMPFIDGESLRTRLARNGALDVATTLRVLREVTSALVAAHARGVVHRDVKPDNILFAGDVAVVTDFGVAKALRRAARNEDVTSLTRTGFVVGTPAYMAPEQAAGDASVDGRADLYALGCVAFEMLAGRPPFAARTIPALMAAQISQRAPDLAIEAPHTPPRVVALVQRCLAKSPDDRHASADALLRELDDILSRSSATLASVPTDARAAIPANTRAPIDTPPARAPIGTAPVQPTTNTAAATGDSRATSTPKLVAVALVMLVGTTLAVARC